MQFTKSFVTAAILALSMGGAVNAMPTTPNDTGLMMSKKDNCGAGLCEANPMGTGTLVRKAKYCPLGCQQWPCYIWSCVGTTGYEWNQICGHWVESCQTVSHSVARDAMVDEDDEGAYD